MKWVREAVYLVIILVMILVAIFLYDKDPVTITVDRVVTQVDTLVVVDTVLSDPIYIEKKVVLYDTIYVDRSGDSIKTETARLDTTFEDSAKLSVSYYITPRVYDISYVPAPVKSQTITRQVTETVYVDSSAWWDKAWIGSAVSLGVIILLK